MIYFDNIDLTINGSGIICDNASLRLSNNINPIYSLGRRGTAGQFTNNGPTPQFGFSYVAELDNEPNYDIVNSIKSNLSSDVWTGVTIQLGGITGYNCFIDSYSLEASPNQLIKCNAAYTSFEPVSGNLQNKTGTHFNITNNLAHSWTTFILNSGNYLNVPTYNFSYSFKATWEPIYIIGCKIPSSVLLKNTEEQLSFVRDSFLNIKYGGEELSTGYFSYNSGNFNITLLNLSNASGVTGYGALYFNIKNCQLKNVDVNANAGDFAKVTTQAYRYY